MQRLVMCLGVTVVSTWALLPFDFSLGGGLRVETLGWGVSPLLHARAHMLSKVWSLQATRSSMIGAGFALTSHTPTSFSLVLSDKLLKVVFGTDDRVSVCPVTLASPLPRAALEAPGGNGAELSGRAAQSVAPRTSCITAQGRQGEKSH